MDGIREHTHGNHCEASLVFTHEEDLLNTDEHRPATQNTDCSVLKPSVTVTLKYY